MSWLSDTTGGATTTQLLGMIGGHQQERRNYRNNQRFNGFTKPISKRVKSARA